MESGPPAVEPRVLTTGSRGKSFVQFFFKKRSFNRDSPTGTFSQVVISLGVLLLSTGPTSEAHVSPAEPASAAKRDKHIQEAVCCLEKSIGISPGPLSIMYSRASSVGTAPLQNTWIQFLCPPRVKQESEEDKDASSSGGRPRSHL